MPTLVVREGSVQFHFSAGLLAFVKLREIDSEELLRVVGSSYGLIDSHDAA